MQIDFPFHIGPDGRTATADEAGHLRDLIEQVLFTAPGERVNRPDFGSGLLQLVFAPNSPELASAVQLLAQSSLQRWLGELLVVEAIEVRADEGRLEVRVAYQARRSGERASARFSREAPL